MDENAKINKQRQKALDKALIDECKTADGNFAAVLALLEQGADIRTGHCKPFETACKRQNAALAELLLQREGADRTAAVFLANMCAFKGYEAVGEERFFALLDLARLKTGADTLTLVTPFIDKAALCGDFEALKRLKKRFYLTDADIAKAVRVRIIFEVINNGYDEMLAYIEKSNDWIDLTAMDLAVSGNEFVVLEYILKSGFKQYPSDKAVAQAVYEGYFAVLDTLFASGYDFGRKGAFLFAAARAAYSKGTDSLRYLLKRGYSLRDRYNSRTLMENAVIDANKPLIEFLKNTDEENSHR